MQIDKRLGALAVVLASSVFGSDYTTYIGDQFPYLVTAITTDSAGNTYVTGSRNGVTGPTAIIASTAFRLGTPVAPLPDVFVTKLDPAGNILFTTTISGKSSDQANAIALDPFGNIYVGGSTASANFPLRDALQTTASTATTGFIVKLSPDGGTMLYSTYFGGTLGASSVTGLAVDAKSNLYITGYTYAPDFPVTAGLPAGPVTYSGVPEISGGFFAKISPGGDQILYAGLLAGQTLGCPSSGSTCFLSGRTTSGVGIAVDGSGNAYLAGNTNTIDLTGSTGALLARGTGAFVAKVNAAGSALANLTFLSAGNSGTAPFAATPDTSLSAIAVDSLGNAYLTGSTSDPQFPVTVNPLQQVSVGHAFAAKLKPDGSGLSWATYLGSSSAGAGQALAVDASGNVWVAGTTSSSSFPNPNGWTQGGDFLVEVNSSGATLSYAAQFPSGSAAQAVALDGSGTVHVSGQNGLVSAITPTLPFRPRIFGIVNAAAGQIAGRISPGEIVSLYGPAIGPSAPVTAVADALGVFPKSLGGVQLTINGIAAPLLYVSASQINAVIPFGVTSETASLQITNEGNTLPAFRAMVDSSAPGIFGSGEGIVNQDGSVNSASNPAKAGSIVSFWATGTGAAQRTDGQVQTSAQNNCSACMVFIDLAQANVLYAGSAPGLVAGVTQVNVQVGDQSGPVNLSVGGRNSPSVQVFVTP